jgi:ATP-dependent DNA ligase
MKPWGVFFNLLMKARGEFEEGIVAADMSAFSWERPRVSAPIDFLEWTRAGLLRRPTFRGIREDKRAGDVRRAR